ncbi:MAG: carboxylate-amine ligase [Gaiellaceae bacterium]
MTDWGPGGDLTVGVEEELMVLDAETLAQVGRAQVLVEADQPPRGEVKYELFNSVVELATDVCADAESAARSVRELRAHAAGIAGANGLALAAAGTHPLSISAEQEIAPDPRYLEFVAYAGQTARRQGVNGLHVHIGMPDAETCLHTMENAIPWLPVLLALSANSPWYEGEETGLLSTRAEVLALLPRHGAPPRFESWADWERLVAAFVDAGVVTDYNAIHWDIRPHPKYGTLEIRITDQATDLARTGAFVAALRGLCAWAREQPRLQPDPLRRAVYDQNRWAAARFGPRATLIHPDGSGAATVAELWQELVERTGVDAGIDATMCEGDRQLGVGKQEGLQAVCADLVVRSVAFAS